jgi:hypothetical protein
MASSCEAEELAPAFPLVGKVARSEAKGRKAVVLSHPGVFKQDQLDMLAQPPSGRLSAVHLPRKGERWGAS